MGSVWGSVCLGVSGWVSECVGGCGVSGVCEFVRGECE